MSHVLPLTCLNVLSATESKKKKTSAIQNLCATPFSITTCSLKQAKTLDIIFIGFQYYF